MNRLNKKYLKIFFLTFAFTILLFTINIFTSLAIYEKANIPTTFLTSFEVMPDKNQWAYETVVKLIKAGLITDKFSEEELDKVLNFFSNFEISTKNKAKHITYCMLLISLFNLAIGYFVLFIYNKKMKLWIWVLGVSSQMRVLLSLYQLMFNTDDFDIVTGHSYFVISPILIYIISLIIGFICFILYFKKYKYEDEEKYILVETTVLGGFFAFLVLEIIRQVYLNIYIRSIIKANFMVLFLSII